MRHHVSAVEGSPVNVHSLVLTKLKLRSQLSQAACVAIETAPFVFRDIPAGAQIVRDGGSPAAQCSIVLDGVAIRSKTTRSGGRQIAAIEIRGDFLDLAHLFLDIADHDVEALTPLRVAAIERDILRELALEHRDFGKALWTEALVEASIAREWMTNLGRRDARTRVAHVLCELAVRSQAVGLAAPDTLLLPWTQEQLGDVTGLTPVHVNRMLRSLEDDELIARRGRQVQIVDRAGLREAGEFEPRYLHLVEIAQPGAAAA
jgi:CRP-like cAMP-binding protein